MNVHDYLDFEQPLIEVQKRLDELDADDPQAGAQRSELEQQLNQETQKIFSDLSIWQHVLLARHGLRPHTIDVIGGVFTGFTELHGDRRFGDDAAIVGGLAHLDGAPVMVIGHEKGRTPEERGERNFGMPQPEGLRKALRLMRLAERFSLPVLTFVDTPGAYPGAEGEVHNQNEAIASNLAAIYRLRVPVIATVIGEGGSGGALAIGCGDWLQMMQFSVYSVATPEACSSIVWRSPDHAEAAAEAMKLVPDALLELGVIDRIVPEPSGGAHRDLEGTCALLRSHLSDVLKRLRGMPVEQLLRERTRRFRALGD
ncbi:MAG: acetyl-CoA carboxylase carboxyltransferase subunit alpha [Gammaproteobacteria bacterium AqS3]|nr:acetyl-CoA carboxylase carboxyltransferase subunit alpha [Gammaproteobacteria bacterium AqS3]